MSGEIERLQREVRALRLRAAAHFATLLAVGFFLGLAIQVVPELHDHGTLILLCCGGAIALGFVIELLAWTKARDR